MEEFIEWTHYLDKYFANKARAFLSERDKVTFASAYLRGNIEAARSHRTRTQHRPCDLYLAAT
jgi:hypothetical protein